MPFIHKFIAALAIAALGLPPAAGSPPQTETTEFIVFVGGRQIGREEVTVSRAGGDRLVASTGRHAAPINMTINRFEARYTADWQPIELTIDARFGDRAIGLKTSFGLTTAINEITQGGTTNSKTDQVSARTVVLRRNYRSLAPVLDAAYRLIRFNDPDRLEVRAGVSKRLRP